MNDLNTLGTLIMCSDGTTKLSYTFVLTPGVACRDGVWMEGTLLTGGMPLDIRQSLNQFEQWDTFVLADPEVVEVTLRAATLAWEEAWQQQLNTGKEQAG